MGTDSCLFFQKWSKSVHDNWPKGQGHIGCFTEKKTKHIFAPLEGTPGAISPKFFCVSAHCGTSFIMQISSRFIQVWEVITEKDHRDTQSKCNLGSLRL